VIRGVLFDLDGVLADSERLHWEGYRRVLAEYGIDVGIEEYRRYWIAQDGGPEYACATYRLPMTADELRKRKSSHYHSLLRAGVRPLPGAREAVARLGTAVRLAVATNAWRNEVELILDQLGMTQQFAATVAREDYPNAKPAPDAYLAAARALGLERAECVVVEDTQRGARAAAAAGIRAIAVPNDLTYDHDFTGCVRRLDNLDQLTVELLGEIGNETEGGRHGDRDR
jgi:HAD superfamily hydrolase (TIGR01509 family)